MLAGKERQKEETAGTEQADLQTSSDELIDDSVMRTSSLHSVDLSLSYKKEEYKKYLGNCSRRWNICTESCTAGESP